MTRFALALLVLSLFAPRIVEAEQLCTDLGADCVCSEPLQATDSPVDGNPNDTSTKQCNQISSNNFGNLSYVTVSDYPSTATATRALRITGGQGTSLDAATPTMPTTGSVCWRHYTRWSADAVRPEAGTGRRKLSEMEDSANSAGNQMQGEIGSGSSDFRIFWSIGGTGAACDYGTFPASGDALNMDDCRSNWCRMEHCVSGNLSTGDTVQGRMRIVKLGADGAELKTRTWTRAACNLGHALKLRCYGCGSDGNPTDSQNFIFNAYTEGTDGTTGYREASYGMAATSTDTAFWIGAAEEIEGSGIPGTVSFSPSTSSATFTQWQSPSTAADVSIDVTASEAWTITTDVAVSAQGTPPFTTERMCVGDHANCDGQTVIPNGATPLSGSGDSALSIDSRNWSQSPPGVYVVTYTATCATCSPTTATHVRTITINNPAAPSPAPATIPAFPGAVGCGSLAYGGRGPGGITPTVHWVTTLEDLCATGGTNPEPDQVACTGSLRACLNASGPRYCLFAVSGTIRTEGYLSAVNPYVTIAGQTSTGGIQITNDTDYTDGGYPSLLLYGHDSVVRYMRLRPGAGCSAALPYPDPAPSGCLRSSDPIGMGRGQPDATYDGFRFIGDHLSLSFANDENADVWGARHVTLQNSILSHPLVNNPAGEGSAVGYQYLIGMGSDCVTVTRNYFAHGKDRGGPHISSGRTEAIDNVYLYPSTAGGRVTAVYYDTSARINFLGNVMKRIGASSVAYGFGAFIDNSAPNGAALMADSIFASDNIASGGMTEAVSSADLALYGAPARHSILPEATSIGSSNVVASVLPTVGASRALSPSSYDMVDIRDAYDTAVVGDWTDETGPTATVIDHEAELGGVPTMGTGHAWNDTDTDGMPDAYEVMLGFDANDPADGFTDRDGDGYTNLEEFLNATNVPGGVGNMMRGVSY